MARRTININDELNKRINEYTEKYNMTVTALITIAVETYLNNKEKGEQFSKLLEDAFTRELEKLGENLAKKT